ncbi:hypothetical protein [Falsiroseomonas sp.]|uniref:hypothetical protein n=1 Tax=Falsiroseomonas sp. TaxID=2870721 RepID=UPI0034A29211
MSTLLVTEAPFRGLLSRAIIEATVAALRPGAPLLLATDAPQAPEGFLPQPLGTLPAGVEEAVLTGVFLDRVWLEGAVSIAAAAVAAGLRLRVHNLGLEDKALGAAPPDVGVLEKAGTLGLRDHRTANALTLWRVAADMRVLGYPERHVVADATLAAMLPAGRILGLALRGRSGMAERARLPAILQRLGAKGGWSVLPLPVAGPGTADDETATNHAAAAALLPDAPLLLPKLGEPAFWQQEITPARLKGLVARCDLVLTNRDLVAGYAASCGVPVIGLQDGPDRRIVSCMATLANAVAPGSALMTLPAVGEGKGHTA